MSPYVNPFAAPAESPRAPAEATERSLWDLAWLLFGFEGRIPRRAWWGGHVLAAVGIYLAVIPIALVAGDNDTLLTALLYALYAPFLWSSCALSAKRFHDLGHSGWWSLITFVPCGGMFVWVFCGFIRGSTGMNAFGREVT